MANPPYITGYNTAEQAHICLYHCDHAHNPNGCVINGAVYPEKRRCALERHLDKKRSAVPPQQIPPDHLTVRQAAQRLGLSFEMVRIRAQNGKFPGARKLGPSRTAPWIIPTQVVVSQTNES